MTQLRLSYIDIQLTLSQHITETLASLFLLLSYSKYRCKWNQPRHSPAEKWVQKILYVYIVEFGFEEGPHSNLGCNKTYLIAQTGLELCLLSVGITGVSLFNHKDNCNQGIAQLVQCFGALKGIGTGNVNHLPGPKEEMPKAKTTALNFLFCISCFKTDINHSHQESSLKNTVMAPSPGASD